MNKIEVLELLRQKKIYQPKGKFMIYHNNEPLYIDNKAKHMYIGEGTAIKMAAKHLYTTKEVIQEMIVDGILEIRNIK
jgi:hypothetical protein